MEHLDGLARQLYSDRTYIRKYKDREILVL